MTKKRSVTLSIGTDIGNEDPGLIDYLISSGVLRWAKKPNLVRLSYDIFEDIWFERNLERINTSAKGDLSVFFKDINELGYFRYRQYRKWLGLKTSINGDDKLVSSLLDDPCVPKEWRRQTLIFLCRENLPFSLLDRIFGNRPNKELVELCHLVIDWGLEIEEHSDDSRFVPCGTMRQYLHVAQQCAWSHQHPSLPGQRQRRDVQPRQVLLYRNFCFT